MAPHCIWQKLQVLNCWAIWAGFRRMANESTPEMNGKGSTTCSLTPTFWLTIMINFAYDMFTQETNSKIIL